MGWRAFRYQTDSLLLVKIASQGGDLMCYTCGCKLPYEDHGDPANLIEEHLTKAGQTETIKRAGTKKAKENMMELLQLQTDAGDLERPNEDYSQ
jgi:hypothetical protein